MVIYDLCCEYGHTFEGWFKNSEDVLAQQNNGMLCCPFCDSVNVTKKLTASRLTKKSNNSSISPSSQLSNLPSKQSIEVSSNNHVGNSPEKFAKLQSMLGEVHKYIDTNFKDVGNRFSEEAISIHKGDIEASNIRGTATGEQIKEMAEEGVQAVPLPPKPIDRKKIN